jgi:hypothetical protein
MQSSGAIMAASVRTKVEPIDRDIKLMISEELSPQAKTQIFKQMALEEIRSTTASNRQILGRVPNALVTVDGRVDPTLGSLRADSVVVAEFELVNDVLIWIGDQLEQHSPVGRSGRYRASHTLLADGVEVRRGETVPPAEEYVFINTQPYARKIELGSSSQAPDGVYQVVAVLAKRFGNIAKVSFGYRVPMFGAINQWASSTKSGSKRRSRAEWLRRQPAIIVRTR